MKNKKLTYLLIILLSVIVLGLSIFLVILLINNKILNSFNLFSFKNNINNNLVLNKTYENGFKNIIVESNLSDIEIKNNNNKEIKILIYGNNDKFKIENNNEVLNLQYKEKSCTFLCFTIKNSKIEIYLPKDYDQNVDIFNNYGDINIGSFKKLNSSINTDSGDIKISFLNKANIKNKYGDIKISEYIKNLKVITNSGDIKVSKGSFINIKNSYGDIDIDKVNNYLDIDSNSGDIKIDKLLLKKNSSIINKYGDIKINGTNKIYIDAKTRYGDTNINNNYRESDIVLTIKNSSGDIKVNN